MHASHRFHILNKIINAFRDPSKSFVLGDHVVHLQLLRDLVGETAWDIPFHKSDLLKFDPMNVRSSLNLVASKVTQFLEKLTDGPKSPYRAIIIFLTMLRSFIHGFVDHDQSYCMLDRLRDIAAAVSFVRYWRYDVQHVKLEALNETFITQNAYEGMELNLHSLVYVVKHLRTLGGVLSPWSLGSQGCEKLFRHVRAYSSRGSTMVHVTMESFLQRLRCIIFDGVFVGHAGLSRTHQRHGKQRDLQHPDADVRVSVHQPSTHVLFHNNFQRII